MIMRKILRHAALAATACCTALLLAGCATTSNAYKSGGPSNDMITVTAQSPYRPVNLPGTQRRTAQNDAEAEGRRLILEQVGAMPLPRGGTVNDVMAQNTVMRAEILNAVRTAEVVDWKVDPACGQVTVWMRLDVNCIRWILAQYGHY